MIIQFEINKAKDYTFTLLAKPGLAHWGSIRLVPSTVVDLNLIVVGSVGSVVARDVTFDPNDGSHLFVATESGILCICYNFFWPS